MSEVIYFDSFYIEKVMGLQRVFLEGSDGSRYLLSDQPNSVDANLEPLKKEFLVHVRDVNVCYRYSKKFFSDFDAKKIVKEIESLIFTSSYKNSH